MKALVLREHGGLENLKVVHDHPMPVAKEGWVVIRVRASSFNYHDVFTVKGMPGIKVPLPVVIAAAEPAAPPPIARVVIDWLTPFRSSVPPKMVVAALEMAPDPLRRRVPAFAPFDDPMVVVPV